MKQPTQAEILEEAFGDHPRCCVFCQEEVPTQDALRIHVFDKHGQVVDLEFRLLMRKRYPPSQTVRITAVGAAWNAEYARYSH